MSQTQKILRALQTRPLTQADAIDLCRCYRLAARINDLRAAGHNIITETIEHDGIRFARYHLVERKAA